MDAIFEVKGAFNYTSDGIVRIEMDEDDEKISFSLTDLDGNNNNVFVIYKNTIIREDKTNYYHEYECSDGRTISIDYLDQSL